MDSFISLVTVSPIDFERLVKLISRSNLSLRARADLKDILKTACQQTQQAQLNGWISTEKEYYPL